MIKNILLAIAAMSIMFLASCSQEDLEPVDEVITQTIPQDIKQSFKSSFPEATETNWTIAGELYLVEFMNNDVRSGAIYEKPNNLYLDWHVMDSDLLPQDIVDYLAKNYPEATITETKRITLHDDNNKGAIRFELTIGYKNRTVFLEFKPDGTILSAKSDKEHEGHPSCGR